MKRSLLEALKQNLRSRGFTQQKLAKQVGVSLPTLKRWLRGDGLDLDAFEKLLTATGLTLSEIVALSDAGSAKTFHYTEAQERFLAKNLEALTMFDHLLHGFSTTGACKAMNLSKASATKTLQGLESVALIERHAGEKIKLLVQGEPIWRKNGPLSQTFKRNAIRGFLDQDFAEDGKTMGTYWLTPEDKRKALTLLDDLRDFLTRAQKRSQLNPERARLHGLFSAFHTFDWSILAPVLALLTFSACAQTLPLVRFETPEAVGREKRGRAEFAAVQSGVSLSDPTTSRVTDSDTGETGDFLALSPANFSTGFVMGIADRWELGLRIQPNSPFAVRGKYQFYGEPESRAQKGFAVAAALAPGFTVGQGATGTNVFFTLDVSVPAGYRINPHHLLWIAPAFAMGMATDLETTAGAYDETLITYGANLGYQVTFLSFFLRFEGGYSGGVAGDAKWKGPGYGAQLGMKF